MLQKSVPNVLLAIRKTKISRNHIVDRQVIFFANFLPNSQWFPGSHALEHLLSIVCEIEAKINRQCLHINGFSFQKVPFEIISTRDLSEQPYESVNTGFKIVLHNVVFCLRDVSIRQLNDRVQLNDGTMVNDRVGPSTARKPKAPLVGGVDSEEDISKVP